MPERYFTEDSNAERFLTALRRSRQAPVYAEVLQGIEIQGLEDLGKLPFTQKSWMKDRPAQDFLATEPERLWHYHESFGTTGSPVCGWYTLEDFEAELPLVRTWLEPFRPGAIIVNRYPYSFPVPAQLVEIATRKVGGCCIPASNLAYNVSFPRVLDIMKRIGATTVTSMPLEPVMLEECCRLLGMDPRKDFPTMEAFCVAGRVLSPTMKRMIERHWDVAVHNLYGSTEGGPYATSNAEGLLRLHTDGFVFEVLDSDTKEPVGDGEEGVLVATTLTREAQPMIRYWTGDRVRLLMKDAGGKPGPFIQVLGRDGDDLIWGSARWTVHDLEEQVLSMTEEVYDSLVFFFVVTRRGLTIRMETRRSRDRATQGQMQEKLSQALGLPVHLEILAPGGLMNPIGLTQEIRVFKPRMLSDARKGAFIMNHSEAMVDWFGDLTPARMLEQMMRGVRNWVRRWTFRLLQR